MLKLIETFGWTAAILLGIGWTVYKLFNGVINRKLAAWQNKDVEEHKHLLTLQADAYRNTLHIKANQTGETFTKQVEAYKTLQVAMRNAVQAVDDAYDYGGEYFRSIKAEDSEAYHKSLEDCRLLLTDDQWKAADFFGDVLAGVVPDPDGPPPNPSRIQDAYGELQFIQDRINNALRRAIGIPVEGNPLLDVHIYHAYKIVHGNSESEVPGVPSEIFRLRRYIGPENVVEKFRQSLMTLRSDIGKMLDYENSMDARSRYDYQKRTQLKWYMDRITRGDN